MKYYKKFIVSAVLLAIISFIIFNVIFTLGMIDTNRPKSIHSDIVAECVTDLKNNNQNLKLKNLDFYYQQGKFHANIYFENNLSLDESKTVVKSLKEFILKDKINKYLLEKHMPELSIWVVVCSNDNSYYYQCPYYLRTTDNSNVKNNYKIWYLAKSSGETIEAINID